MRHILRALAPACCSAMMHGICTHVSTAQVAVACTLQAGRGGGQPHQGFWGNQGLGHEHDVGDIRDVQLGWNDPHNLERASMLLHLVAKDAPLFGVPHLERIGKPLCGCFLLQPVLALHGSAVNCPRQASISVWAACQGLGMAAAISRNTAWATYLRLHRYVGRSGVRTWNAGMIACSAACRRMGPELEGSDCLPSSATMYIPS
jgi:hypothetical protein